MIFTTVNSFPLPPPPLLSISLGMLGRQEEGRHAIHPISSIHQSTRSSYFSLHRMNPKDPQHISLHRAEPGRINSLL
jgi:hypothetical protein